MTVIIGLAGPARAGKSTVADHLARRYGFVKFAFSDALYREVSLAFDVHEEMLRDPQTKELPQEWLEPDRCADENFCLVARRMIANLYPDTYFPLDSTVLSPRQVLQWWGTEYRREQDPEYWVKRARDFVRETQSRAPYPEQTPQFFVECGTRFENERTWIKSYPFGTIWHIHRGDDGDVNSHSSTIPLPVLSGERELWNNDSLDALHRAVDLLLTTGARFVRAEPMLDPSQGCLGIGGD